MNPHLVGIGVMFVAFIIMFIGVMIVTAQRDRARQQHTHSETQRVVMQQQLRAERDEARANYNTAVELAAQYKDNAKEWRELALQSSAHIHDLTRPRIFDVDAGAIRDIRNVDTQADGAIADPPSVGESDRAAAEARRTAGERKQPLKHGRRAVSTEDPERRPAHRARETEAL